MTWHDIIQLHVAGAQGEGAGKQKGLVELRWTDVPEALRTIADRMRVSLDVAFPVELSPAWRGARAMAAVAGGRGNRIRLGGALARSLSAGALDGVMAHELAHLKCRHWELLLLGCVLAALGGVALGLALDLPTALRMVVGGMVPILSAASLSWIAEYEADRVAARYVGYDVMALTLRELRDSGFRTRAEFTHPPDSSRVRRLLSAGAGASPQD